MGLAPVIDISLARRRRNFIRECRAQIARWAQQHKVPVDTVVRLYCRTNRIDQVTLGRLTDAHTVRLLADLNDRTRRETEALMQPGPAYHGRPIPTVRSGNIPRNGRVMPADVA